MNYFDANVYNYPGYGGKNDVKLTPIDYKEFIDCLEEEQLSKNMSFKFKKATLANTHYVTGSLIMPLVIGYGVARWVSGPFFVGVHRNKTMFPIMGVIFYWDFWRRMHRPISRRLYTEMLSDETEDGTYLRK